MAITAIQTWRPPQAAERDRKGDRTRAQLFAAAVAEFRRVGFEPASIGQIATRAGTSRANFYVYHPCKEAVLLDLQWQMELEMVERNAGSGELRTGLDPVQASDLFLCSLFGLLLGLRGPLASRRAEARQLSNLFLQEPTRRRSGRRI